MQFSKVLCIFAAILFSTVQLPAQQESNDFSYALKLYNEGFYDISAQQFSNFLARYPGSERLPEARYYFGDALFKLNEIENARIEFQALAVSFPDHQRAPQGCSIRVPSRHDVLPHDYNPVLCAVRAAAMSSADVRML